MREFKMGPSDRQWLKPKDGGGVTQVALPDYCNDLNAMSEVEDWMVGRGYGGSYQAELQAMAGGYLSYHLASASQRARAAILVLENAKGDA